MATSKDQVAKKPRLGRGLSSLITNSSHLVDADASYVPVEPHIAAEAHAAGKVPIVARPQQEIAIDEIAVNPYQPRHEFKEEQLADLTASIARQGVLQPLMVCPARDGQADRPYVLIAGERRLRAAKRAGLDRVPCVVRHASPQEMLEWALVENIQREDLGTMERARAYQEYMDRFVLTQAEAAERLGQARATVANYVRMLDLQADVQAMLSDGALTFGHGKALAGLVGEAARQLALARRVLAEGLSVRQTEALAAEKPGMAVEVSAENSAPRAKAAYVLDAEERLTQAVGTRVKIVPGRKKHSGKILVEYYSLDDFDRIAGSLGLRKE